MAYLKLLNAWKVDFGKGSTNTTVGVVMSRFFEGVPLRELFRCHEKFNFGVLSLNWPAFRKAKTFIINDF